MNRVQSGLDMIESAVRLHVAGFKYKFWIGRHVLAWDKLEIKIIIIIITSLVLPTESLSSSSLELSKHCRKENDP